MPAFIIHSKREKNNQSNTIYKLEPPVAAWRLPEKTYGVNIHYPLLLLFYYIDSNIVYVYSQVVTIDIE